MNDQESTPVVETNNEKYKYDKNAILSKPFPFKASEFKYPNDGQEKPKSLYITTNDTYGKIKPNDLELPEKYFPRNTKFTTSNTFNISYSAMTSRIRACLVSFTFCHPPVLLSDRAFPVRIS